MAIYKMTCQAVLKRKHNLRFKLNLEHGFKM